MRLHMILPNPYHYIGGFCVVLSVIRGIASVYLGVQAVITLDVEVYEIQWKWLIFTVFAVGAAVDVIIALSMVYYLSGQRGNVLQRSRWFLTRSELS